MKIIFKNRPTRFSGIFDIVNFADKRPSNNNQSRLPNGTLLKLIPFSSLTGQEMNMTARDLILTA